MYVNICTSSWRFIYIHIYISTHRHTFLHTYLCPQRKKSSKTKSYKKRRGKDQLLPSQWLMDCWLSTATSGKRAINWSRPIDVTHREHKQVKWNRSTHDREHLEQSSRTPPLLLPPSITSPKRQHQQRTCIRSYIYTYTHIGTDSHCLLSLLLPVADVVACHSSTCPAVVVPQIDRHACRVKENYMHTYVYLHILCMYINACDCQRECQSMRSQVGREWNCVATTTTATTTSSQSKAGEKHFNWTHNACDSLYIHTYITGALRGGVLFTLYFCRMFLSAQIGAMVVQVCVYVCVYAYVDTSCFCYFRCCARRRAWKIFQLPAPLPAARLWWARATLSSYSYAVGYSPAMNAGVHEFRRISKKKTTHTHTHR